MQITAKALLKITDFLSKEDKSKVFRLGVSSGGCSGFSYKTEISDPQPDDIKLDGTGFLVIDPVSKDMLENTTLDYVDEIGHAGFIFTNPDASSTCGCGISFDF